MSVQHTIAVPDEIWAELQTKADAEGKTVNAIAEEALREGLRERTWQDLLAYGRERALGCREEDVPEIVHRQAKRGL